MNFESSLERSDDMLGVELELVSLLSASIKQLTNTKEEIMGLQQQVHNLNCCDCCKIKLRDILSQQKRTYSDLLVMYQELLNQLNEFKENGRTNLMSLQGILNEYLNNGIKTLLEYGNAMEGDVFY